MEIRSISWQQTIPLRHSLLWPTKSPAHCHVEGDDNALHFGAFDDDRLICVASVYINFDKARLLELLYAGILKAPKRGIYPEQNWNLMLSQQAIHLDGRLVEQIEL